MKKTKKSNNRERLEKSIIKMITEKIYSLADVANKFTVEDFIELKRLVEKSTVKDKK